MTWPYFWLITRRLTFCVGVSSPVTFGSRRTRAEADAIVANAIRTAMARTGAERVLLMGQSFGADIVSAIAPDLPADLRAWDIFRAVALSLTLSFVVTIFPARRAARMNPVEALRYE